MTKFWTVLSAAFVVVMLGIAPSAALPDGPDPDNGHPTFDIFFAELSSAKPLYDRLTFQESTGWDFGDRNAYRCAWAEFYQGTNERFEVHFERVPGYDPGVLVNDRYGTEATDSDYIGSLCGDGNRRDDQPQWDGSDHFPHGTALTVTEGSTTIATLDLHRDECAKGYWVAGDEPGEAWLWWDADGPTSNGHHTLNCGGGPGDPVAVLRMTVQNVDAGLDYCIEDSMDGDICTTPVITLGAGSSILVCPDGSTPQIVTSDPLKVGC